MDGVIRADLQGVAAPLNFMEPMAEKPYSYNYDPPPGGKIGQSIRIGISRDANRLLRFYLRGSPFVSGPRSLKE